MRRDRGAERSVARAYDQHVGTLLRELDGVHDKTAYAYARLASSGSTLRVCVMAVEYIARVGELIERAAEPQHLLGRSLIERAPRAVTELGLERALRQRMIAITAERAIDEMLMRLARRSRDPHPGIEMIVSRATETVVGPRIHLGHERARGVAHGRVGEMLEAHDAVHQRAGEHILDAEFAVEAALRIGPVGVLQPARMGPRFDSLDALGREPMRGTQMQHGVGGRMS